MAQPDRDLILVGSARCPRHSLHQMERPIRRRSFQAAVIAAIGARSTIASTRSSSFADIRILPAC